MLSTRALFEILLATWTADAPRETTRARFQSELFAEHAVAARQRHIKMGNIFCM